MNETLSIIVPVYNVERYLDQCIRSILNQDYRNFVLILVDDGSTDSSGSKCEDWAKKDQRIIVYHKENGGLMSAWKYGLLHAQTEYIGFVDSDDWIDSDMYSRLLEEAIRTQSDITICGWIGDCKAADIQQKENVKLAGYTFQADEFREKLYPILISGGNYQWMGISPNRWTKLYRRELLIKNLSFCDERVSIGEDLLVNFCTIPYAGQITIMKDFHPYHYRIHEESMIHKYTDENYKKINLLHECLLKVNAQWDYDFEIQINTYYMKLILSQLDNEMLFGKKSSFQLKKRMKMLYKSKRIQKALNKSEMEKLPLKYRLYITCIKLHLYSLILLIRKVKKI